MDESDYKGHTIHVEQVCLLVISLFGFYLEFALNFHLANHLTCYRGITSENTQIYKCSKRKRFLRESRGVKGGRGGLNDEGGHLVRNFKGRWGDRHLKGHQRSEI